MGVPYFAAIHHVRHLHARSQLIRLGTNRKNAHLAGFEVIENRLRHIDQRAGSHFFENPGVIAQAPVFQLLRQAG